jgi:hypothetical protein
VSVALSNPGCGGGGGGGGGVGLITWAQRPEVTSWQSKSKLRYVTGDPHFLSHWKFIYLTEDTRWSVFRTLSSSSAVA